MALSDADDKSTCEGLCDYSNTTVSANEAIESDELSAFLNDKGCPPLERAGKTKSTQFETKWEKKAEAYTCTCKTVLPKT